MFKLSSRSLQRMAGIDNRMFQIAERAIQITLIDFGIPKHGGLRTAEQQHQLYLHGVSNADGYTDLSNHQSGRALDFYAIDEFGKASWETGLLAQVACAFFQSASELEYKVRWGGLWADSNGKGWDMPHMELV